MKKNLAVSINSILTVVLLSICLLFLSIPCANAATIKTSGLTETKLYDLYSEVQSQILLNALNNQNSYSKVKSFDDIERNPSSHVGDKMYFEGKIIQVVEGSSSTTYRIAMDGKTNQVFLVTYSRPEDTERFLEDDQVCVYADFIELKTYSSTTNKSVTAPYCDASLIIRPVSSKNVIDASDDDLNQALSDIRAQLQKVVKTEKGYNKLTSTNYTDYARHDALHADEKITITGKVLQVVEGTYRNAIRLAVDSNSDNVVYLIIEPETSTIRILENDTITIQGTYTGLYTYSSTMGGEITIPSCSVEAATVKGYKAPTSFPKDKEGNYKLTKTQFEDYSRRPMEHLNEKITFSAKVLQVIEGDPVSSYRMAIDDKSNYVMYVKISNDDRTMRILEDDKVTVIATYGGLFTYESTYGTSITIPQCTATSIVVPGKAATIAQKDANGNFKVTKTNYESFARDEQTYLNKSVSFTAKVLQVVDGDYTTIYRLAVDKSNDTVFLGTIDNSKLSIRILEDDIVTIIGTSSGLYSYNSTRGGKITIPSCIITEYSVEGYKKQEIGSPDNEGYLKITSKNYNELARNPDPYKGEKLTFKAKVVQVVERSGANIYRVAVNSDNDCIFYVEYTLPAGSSRILEKDNVVLKGEFYGIYTYTTTLGSTVSVPALIATEITKSTTNSTGTDGL